MYEVRTLIPAFLLLKHKGVLCPGAVGLIGRVCGLACIGGVKAAVVRVHVARVLIADHVEPLACAPRLAQRGDSSFLPTVACCSGQ